MAKYGKFLFYKKELAAAQTVYVATTLTIIYTTSVNVSIPFTLLYNILGTDARSLWEPKQPSKALWEALDKSDPASYPVTQALADYLQLQNDLPLENQDGTPMFIE